MFTKEPTDQKNLQRQWIGQKIAAAKIVQDKYEVLIGPEHDVFGDKKPNSAILKWSNSDFQLWLSGKDLSSFLDFENVEAGLVERDVDGKWGGKRQKRTYLEALIAFLAQSTGNEKQLDLSQSAELIMDLSSFGYNRIVEFEKLDIEEAIKLRLEKQLLEKVGENFRLSREGVLLGHWFLRSSGRPAPPAA